MEAAGVEIYRDVNETERLLHIQELGVPGDPTVSAVIVRARAESGQSVRVLLASIHHSNETVRSATYSAANRRVSAALKRLLVLPR